MKRRYSYRKQTPEIYSGPIYSAYIWSPDVKDRGYLVDSYFLQDPVTESCLPDGRQNSQRLGLGRVGTAGVILETDDVY